MHLLPSFVSLRTKCGAVHSLGTTEASCERGGRCSSAQKTTVPGDDLFFYSRAVHRVGEEIWLESANGGITQRGLRRRGDESSLTLGYRTFGDEMPCWQGSERKICPAAGSNPPAPDSTRSSSLQAYHLAPGWGQPWHLQPSVCMAVRYRATGIPSPWLFIRPWGLGCSFSPSFSLPADFNTKSVELSSQPYFLLQQYNITYVFHVVKRLLSLTAMGKVQVCRKHWLFKVAGKEQRENRPLLVTPSSSSATVPFTYHLFYLLQGISLLFHTHTSDKADTLKALAIENSRGQVISDNFPIPFQLHKSLVGKWFTIIWKIFCRCLCLNCIK